MVLGRPLKGDIFRRAVTVIGALKKVYIPYRSLMEALYTLNSPPVDSFNLLNPTCGSFNRDYKFSRVPLVLIPKVEEAVKQGFRI